MRDSGGDIIGYLQEEGDYFIVARGGQGGKGNHFFSTLPKRIPIMFEEGARGQEATVFLCHAIQADIGLVSGNLN